MPMALRHPTPRNLGRRGPKKSSRGTSRDGSGPAGSNAAAATALAGRVGARMGAIRAKTGRLEDTIRRLVAAIPGAVRKSPGRAPGEGAESSESFAERLAKEREAEQERRAQEQQERERQTQQIGKLERSRLDLEERLDAIRALIDKAIDGVDTQANLIAAKALTARQRAAEEKEAARSAPTRPGMPPPGKSSATIRNSATPRSSARSGRRRSRPSSRGRSAVCDGTNSREIISDANRFASEVNRFASWTRILVAAHIPSHGVSARLHSPREPGGINDIKAKQAADPSASKSRRQCMEMGNWGRATQLEKEKRGILRSYTDGASVRITTQSLYEHLIELASTKVRKVRQPAARFQRKRRDPPRKSSRR